MRSRRRPWAMLAACGAVAASAAVVGPIRAAVTTVDQPASVNELAERVDLRASAKSPMIGGCQIFPASNPWNTDISDAPVRSDSAAILNRINASGNRSIHPDFGGNGAYGIPFEVVPATQPRVPIRYTDYGNESDPGPFPIPPDARIEGGSDRHVLVVQQGTCELFELFNASREGNGWAASSGAKFDLRTGALRPIGWTSADAAGLPITPGLVRYDEVAAGEVNHAIRITFSRTQRGFILPATHFASSSSDPTLPPMGLRLRLRADYDLSNMTGHARVIAEAMKTYGVIVADNGSNWFITGAADPRWDDDNLRQLKSIPGTAFEAVDTGPIRTS